MPQTVLTSKNHSITLVVGGLAVPGPWKTFTGGGKKSEGTFNRPGGMADRQALGGVSERENVTITREYDWTRDGALIGPGGYLDQQVDEDGESTVVVQRLNKQKQPVGSPKLYVGTIVGATDAELDSESSDVQIMTVECTAI